MSKLTKALKNVYIGSIGNRVNLAGIASFVGGMCYASYLSNGGQDIYPEMLVPVMLMGGGALVSTFTFFGTETVEHYNRTKEKFEKCSEKNVSNYLAPFVNNDAYCTRQGAYLAAKETGYKEKFREAQKKATKRFRIPNF